MEDIKLEQRSSERKIIYNLDTLKSSSAGIFSVEGIVHVGTARGLVFGHVFAIPTLVSDLQLDLKFIMF